MSVFCHCWGEGLYQLVCGYRQEGMTVWDPRCPIDVNWVFCPSTYPRRSSKIGLGGKLSSANSIIIDTACTLCLTMSASIWSKLEDQFRADQSSWELQKSRAHRGFFFSKGNWIILEKKRAIRSVLHCQFFAGGVIIRGSWTDNRKYNGGQEQWHEIGPEGQSDRINQREEIRCGERTMLERLAAEIDTWDVLIRSDRSQSRRVDGQWGL